MFWGSHVRMSHARGPVLHTSRGAIDKAEPNVCFRGLLLVGAGTCVSHESYMCHHGWGGVLFEETGG